MGLEEWKPKLSRKTATKQKIRENSNQILKKNVNAYSRNHVDSKCYKWIAMAISPVGNYLSLLYVQVIAHPGEVGKQTHNLLLSRQC